MICFLSTGKFCCFVMEKHSIFKEKAEFNFLLDEWAQAAPGREGSTWTSSRGEPVQWKQWKDTWWEEEKWKRREEDHAFPAWPTPHSPDLLSPTSACCNYYADVIQIPKILTQDSKQVAVWTQLWGAHSPIQHKVLVVRKVGGIVRERPHQNFITAVVWCLFRGVRWMWSPRANQSTCLEQKVRQWSQHVQRSYTTSLFHLRFSLTKELILHFPAKQAGDLPESGVQLHWALFLSFLFQTAPQHITASFHF